MQISEPETQPNEAPASAGGALGVCLSFCLTGLLALWLAQDSLAAYWHAHYQRPSPLAALERSPAWRVGAQLYERGLHWREALAVPLRIATPDVAASASAADDGDEPLLLAMAAPQEAADMTPMVQEIAIYEPPLPEYRLPEAPPQAQEALQVARAASDALTLQRQRHEVFFAGDSMMEGVAPHLALWLKKQGIRSTNRSRLSTGLTYPNAKTRDWPREIARALAGNKRLKLIVMFLGPNDPWDMPVPEARGRRFLRFATPEWEEEYRRRISTILDAAKSHGAHVIWMGPPPMRKARLHGQMEYLDEVMRSETEGRAVYISTWALLSSAAGGYTERVEVDGRMVGVRAPDGIHFSPAGQRLLARAVQEHIRILDAEAVAPASPASAPVQLAAAPQPSPAPVLLAAALPPFSAPVEVAAAPLPEPVPEQEPEPASAPPPPPALPVINADGTLTLAANQEAFFAGDSMMQGLAPHIAHWLRQQGIASRNRSRHSTGLTYPNAQTRDWPAEIERALAANKRLKLIFMFVGPNDPLDMPDPSAQKGQRFLRFATPGWEAEYRRRITRILDAADKHGARLVWLGLPTMRAARYEQKMAYLDGV
ncbi:MAG: DUF459 domain-containing protein, partial [Ottowia sp.]|nr:DUF459 domain-containing protein [Ottowia sp.]